MDHLTNEFWVWSDDYQPRRRAISDYNQLNRTGLPVRSLLPLLSGILRPTSFALSFAASLMKTVTWQGRKMKGGGDIALIFNCHWQSVIACYAFIWLIFQTGLKRKLSLSFCGKCQRARWTFSGRVSIHFITVRWLTFASQSELKVMYNSTKFTSSLYFPKLKIINWLVFA